MTAADPRIDLLGQTSAEVAQAAEARLPRRFAGRFGTVFAAAHRDGRFPPPSLDAGAADAFASAFRLDLPEIAARTHELTALGSTTEKLALLLRDGLEVECVRIPIGTSRESLCVSTQVGCRLACRFCETGRMGLVRDLTAGEITAQVVAARVHGCDPRTVVFMGMGEPLDNFDALVQAIRVLTDRRGLAFALDRLTVCTAGHVDGIRRLAALGLTRLNLAVSLNAARDELRDRLMPINRRAPLRELQAALIAYRPRRNFQLGVHYCLLPGINDGDADVAAIAAFAAPLGRVVVHLIPYNPGSRPLTRVPDEDEIVRFVRRLRAHGLPVRRRITKGRSVMAACGQLGDIGLRRRARRPAERTGPDDPLCQVGLSG
jgi:23S rRNA (adenine2503-C2)-methyltransferase